MIWVVVILAIAALVYLPGLWVRQVMRRYSEPGDRYPGSGGQFAAHLLQGLGMSHVATSAIETGDMLPAVAQGAIGIERRLEDARTAAMLAAIHHTPTGQRLAAERAAAELLAEDELAVKPVRRRRGEFPLPSLDLLDEVKKEDRGFTREVLQMNARLLMDTLANFGIEGQINEIRPGPVVTTFEFEPAPGSE